MRTTNEEIFKICFPQSLYQTKMHINVLFLNMTLKTNIYIYLCFIFFG